MDNGSVTEVEGRLDVLSSTTAGDAVSASVSISNAAGG